MADLRAQSGTHTTTMVANAIHFPQLGERHRTCEFRHAKLAATKRRLRRRALLRMKVAELSKVVHANRAFVKPWSVRQHESTLAARDRLLLLEAENRHVAHRS